jgi:type IV pilus assembly protein PilC
MAFYRYVALDANGVEQAGTIEAANPRAAAAGVRERNLRLVRVDALAAGVSTEEGPRQYAVSDFLPVSLSDRVLFFQQLALMLRSGLSVLQSLEVAANLAASSRLRRGIEQIGDRIKNGDSFSAAMDAQGALFPPLAIQLVRSSETSGELDRVLERIAEHLEQKAETRRNLITSLIYPAIVVIVALGVAAFLLTGVVPKFVQFFERSGKALPPMTAALIDVSDWLIAWGPFLLAGIAVVLITALYAYSTKAGRLYLDRILLYVPLIGALLLRASISQFTWAMSILLSSGVTLLDSLRVAKGVVSNKAIDLALDEAAEDLLRGRDFATSLSRKPIPVLITRLSAVGEKSGSLEQVMGELGHHYDQELQASIKRMSSLIEPVLMLIIGGMVGFVYYAFFQAVMSLA